ncbi:hypothetical protein C0Z18_13515 [Trinickia dabaoshanensis]|uniref:Uncharacterized protein n=1 Tax=Trinickia dabaoshanensis TaxID=564714 RepID=A0A2N7VQD5_9BURK|nr:hypothetical protein C0Z18_13515 [Trinickia dabaoshanensis]
MRPDFVTRCPGAANERARGVLEAPDDATQQLMYLANIEQRPAPRHRTRLRRRLERWRFTRANSS